MLIIIQKLQNLVIVNRKAAFLQNESIRDTNRESECSNI